MSEQTPPERIRLALLSEVSFSEGDPTRPIHALRTGADTSAAIRFALGAACIKHTIPGDFNLASAAEIEAFLAADLSVRR